ncbi:glycosyltransferase [Methanoculleus sp. 7T]|uniref:glycosyltransferase n=1 Tax=Methanoculleus sp. 7T TaxID=2937282 RepID=UPI0020C00752|nr:glycosyltransferase [Methanoculleus sp. 7T]MCK8517536.1 glycosyltransferase [Methanoculleus sp. 7T]
MSEPSLRILQVSTVDIAGGAEKIAWDLFTSYRAHQHQSWLAVGTKRSGDADVFSIPKNPNRFSQFISSCFNRHSYAAYVSGRIESLTNPARIYSHLIGHENFDHPETWSLLDSVPERPDILHCHNLHGGYFDLRALPPLSHQVPTVLTLHDAWLLAGHCAHSFDCERWKTGCGNCPDLTIYPAIRRDATAYNWQRKAEIYRKSRLYVVTPCRWLMDKVDQSMLNPGVVASKVIPNGVDLKVFHPADRASARQDLGLPHDATILLFAANGIRKNIWKDYQTLQSALAEIAKTGAKVLCIALGETAPPERIGDVEIRFVPYLKDPRKVARYYQAADLYLHPARADTFPTTVLEALACGTPVVASAVGGIPEQVVEGRTGFLVPVGDARALAERVLDLLADEGLRLRMGRQAAEDAARRFGLERMVGEYLAFYRAHHKGEGI